MQDLASAHKTAPVVIGHRGACGYVPEHTLASYFIAMQDGVDYVEPDLVMTKEGILIARHENEIGGTTDVATRPEFAGRRARKTIDGRVVDGWARASGYRRSGRLTAASTVSFKFRPWRRFWC
jgi:glycerophosphoryl diester phosphodiesterase